jgi:hypothetical protein
MVSPIQGTEAGSDDALVVKIASSTAALTPAVGSNTACLLAGLLLLCGVAMQSRGGGRRRRVAV